MLESFYSLKRGHTENCSFVSLFGLFNQTQRDCLSFSIGLSANSVKVLLWAGTTNWCRSAGISCCHSTAGGGVNSTEDGVEFM